MTPTVLPSPAETRKHAAETLQAAGIQVLSVLYVGTDHILYRPRGGGKPWTAFLGVDENHEPVVIATSEGYPIEPSEAQPEEQT